MASNRRGSLRQIGRKLKMKEPEQLDKLACPLRPRCFYGQTFSPVSIVECGNERTLLKHA